MMTSGQIAGMMTQQNQYFAGAAQYSQQLSQQMPAAYSGAIGQSPGFAPVPGGLPQQAGFSYNGGGGNPYGFSNQLGGTAMSAMGGMAQFGIGAAGIAAGFGMLGRGAELALDPFAGGGVGWRMGGRMAGAMNLGRFGSGAMRLGMGAAGMLPAAGLLAGAGMAIGSMVTGAQEQSNVERVLSQFGNVSGRGPGGGFSRSQARGITDMMKGMEALPEMMTSMSELTRIMDKMGQMGVMQGARNVQEFRSKFKENIKVLKDMSKVMATSMEEALPMFGEIRRSGFYSTGDILKNAMGRQITGGITGMNQGQVGAVAAAGAHMGFATGGSRATGASHALRMANQLGMANKMGVLSGDQIMELTGQEGAAGLAALSTQLTQAGYRMSRGGLGRATTAALAEMEDGRFTGRMDEDLVERFRAGEFSVSDLKRMARRNVRGRAGKMSFVAQEKALRSEMVGAVGVEGQFQMLQNALGGRGFHNPDAMRIVSQRFGLSEREADLMVDLGKRMPDIQTNLRQEQKIEARKMARESFMRENYSWDAVKSKASRKIKNVVQEPFKKMGRDISGAINDAVDEFIDDVTGRYQARVSGEMASLVKESMSGVGGSRQRLSQLYQGAQGTYGMGAILGGGADLTPGMMGAAANWLTGNVTAGERMSNTLGIVGGGKYISRWSGEDASARAMRDRGTNVLSREHNMWWQDDEFTGATNQQILQARKDLLSLSRGEDTEISGKIGGLMGLNKGRVGRQAQAELAAALTGNLGLSLLEGEERVKAIAKEMKGGQAWELLMGGAGKGSEADVLAAIEKASGGALGTGLSGTFKQAATGLRGFRDLEGVNRARTDVEKKIAKALGDELGGEFLALSDKSIKDRSMDLIFSGIGDMSDLAEGTGFDIYGAQITGGRRMDKKSIIHKFGKSLGRYGAPEGLQEAAMKKGAFKGGMIEFEGKKYYRDDFGGFTEVTEEAQEQLALYEGVKGLSKADKELISNKGMTGLLAKYATREASGDTSSRSKAVQKLIDQQGKSYKTLVGQAHARSILRKKSEGGTLNDEEKQFLKDRGMDISSLDGPGGAKRAKSLLGLMAKVEEKGVNDPEVMGLLKKHRDLNVMGSLAGIAQQFKEEGESLGDAVKKLQASENFSEEAQAILGGLGSAADLLTSDDEEAFKQAIGIGEKGGASASQMYSEAAISMMGLDEAEQKRMMKGIKNANLKAAFAKAKTLTGRFKGGQTTVGELLPGFDELSEDMKKQVYDIAASGEGEKRGLATKVDEAEFEKFRKLLVSEQAGAGLAIAGTEEMSRYANPAEIANHMATFGKSVEKLAGYVATLPDAEGNVPAKNAGKAD